MLIGTQYYRPPFPEPQLWEEDFARIRKAGLDCVQIWVTWAWVEPAPGAFRFDDYDQLMESAERHGLGVILSTVAEIQPHWIPQEIPGSELVDHTGQKIVSNLRTEVNFGLTPGACIDHPAVWVAMQRFLTEVVSRYSGSAALRGWDVWNEMRWNVLANALVCYCPSTLASYREWLDAKYGGLEGLNSAWMRRYTAWEQVMPGTLPPRPYTDIMAFQDFLTRRANQHGKARCALVKKLDGTHPVTGHAGAPCPMWVGGNDLDHDHAINRGNDWVFAEDLDVMGWSSFPKGYPQKPSTEELDFAVRCELMSSAAQGRPFWLSELQGGRGGPTQTCLPAVDAISQQRWVWNGIAAGAKGVFFWCWRDEVFGMESGLHGITGRDGRAEERLAALGQSIPVLRGHGPLLDEYRVDSAQVGILFSPQTYYCHWAAEGTAARAWLALNGYARSLTRLSIPYRIMEEEHLASLFGLRILFLPRTMVISESTQHALADFVQNGGTLVCESECGAFDPRGWYFRSPAQRFPARLAGVTETGRRNRESDFMEVSLGGQAYRLRTGESPWITPLEGSSGEVLAEGPEGKCMVRVRVGRGHIVFAGAFFGETYARSWYPDFDRFLAELIRQSSAEIPVRVISPAPDEASFGLAKWGHSSGIPLIFVLFPTKSDSIRLRISKAFFPGATAVDLFTGKTVPLADGASDWECGLTAPPLRVSILAPDGRDG